MKSLEIDAFILDPFIISHSPVIGNGLVKTKGPVVRRGCRCHPAIACVLVVSLNTGFRTRALCCYALRVSSHVFKPNVDYTILANVCLKEDLSDIYMYTVY